MLDVYHLPSERVVTYDQIEAIELKTLDLQKWNDTIEPFLLESLIEDLIYELQDGYDLHFDYVIECGRILLIPLI